MKEGSKFDEILDNLGTGWWNLLHFIGAAFWYMLIPPQAFSGVYLAPNLNYTCIPNQTYNITEIASDSCSYSHSTINGEEEEVPCDEWDFDTSIYKSTLTSEFGLVCSKGYLRATYQSIYMFSSIFGSLVSGYAADKYGRKIVIVISQGLYSLATLSLCLVSNYNTLLALRFILGVLGTPTFYMLGMEVCETKHRSLVGVIMALPWAIGMMLTGGIAYFIRDWRYFQLAVSLPTLLVFPILYLINESPRWLIVEGQHEKALRILRRAEKINKANLPPDHVLKPILYEIQSENSAAVKIKEAETEISRNKLRCLSVPKIASTPKIRLVLGVLSINLFISSMVYCGLSLSGSNYSSDPFLYMVISGLMEVPGYTVTAPIINRWGRKKPAMIGFFICGVVILSLAFIPKSMPGLVMTFAMLGKLAISGSFMILFVYEAELIPTEVRLQGMAMTIIASQIAATLAPYIVEFLGPLIPWLPSVIFGVSSFVASLVLIPIPETNNKGLPDMIGDLERLWRQKEIRTSSDPEAEESLEKLTK